MPEGEPNEISGILAAAENGDRAAVGQLFAILYPELREQAHRRVRKMGNLAVLDTTSLVHESYLRMAQAARIKVENRVHFLAYAAHVMRSIVIDFVRHAHSQRRGGDHLQVTLNSGLIGSVSSHGDEVMRLHELLEELATVDQRLVSLVEMRYFGAFDEKEISECLGVSERTVRRDLRKVRMLLLDAQS